MAHQKGSIDVVSSSDAPTQMAVTEKGTEAANEGVAAAAAPENDGVSNDIAEISAPGNDGGDDCLSTADASDPTDSTTVAAATPPSPPPPPPPPETTTTTTTTTTPPAPLSGFFSRAAAAAQQAHLGDVYELAQRRAAQLREGALAEVERMRQQRQQQQQQQQQASAGELAIPPPAGVLVVGDPPAREDGEGGEAEDDATARDVEVGPTGGREEVAPSSDEAKGETTTTTTTTTTTLRDISAPLRDAFNMVKKTSAEAAKELIFPIDAFSARNDELFNSSSSESCSSGDNSGGSSIRDVGSEEEGDATNDGRVGVDKGGSGDGGNRDGDGNVLGGGGGGGSNNGNESGNGGQNDDENDANSVKSSAAVEAATLAALNLTPTRFTAATNSVFNAAVGRYRRLKENASFDTSSHVPPTPPRHPQPTLQHQKCQPQLQEKGEGPVVGGADLVSGLRNFQLDDLFDHSAVPPSLAAVVDGGTSIPSLPFSKPPPGREILTMQTGGQWTMASNRGPNAVAAADPSAANSVEDGVDTSAGAPFSRSSSINTGSEVASEDGSASARRLPSPRVASSPNRPPQSRPPSRTPSYYEEAVRSVLRPGQRALFFGKGTMGVVLKPTYLASWRGKDGGGVICPTMKSKKGGVYIDSFIPGGHAERSGVVSVGDHVVKIGAVNVENMTLEEVVTVIAESKRPNIMIVTSEHAVEIVDKPEEDRSSVEDDGDDYGKEGMTSKKNRCFVSPLDMAFGFVNKFAAEGILDVGSQVPIAIPQKDYELKHTMSGTSLLDNAEDEDSVESDDGSNSEEEISFNSPRKVKGATSVSVVVASDGPASSNNENSDGSYYVSLTSKPGEIKVNGANGSNQPDLEPEIISTQSNPTDTSISIDIDNLSAYAAHRTNTHDAYDTEFQHRRASLLKRVALFNPDIRSALRQSLEECVSDPRRYTFLEHYFRSYLSKKELDALTNIEQKAQVENDYDDVALSTNQRRLLKLYLELCKFRDAMMLCSVLEREKLLKYARLIAARFLSEDNDAKDKSNGYCLSEYVTHVALGGMEKVQAVRFALRDEDEFFEGDAGDGDGFHFIRSSLEAFLSTQESFLTFLMSNDCARMRAYLRGSSSFLCIEPRMLLKTDAALTDAGVDSVSYRNFLLCAILHLVCMKESSNNSKGNVNNFIKNDALLLNSGKRNLGAASLLGCAFFIMRSLQKKIDAVVEGLIEDGMTGKSNNLPLYLALIEDIQFFWEVYIAPAGGALSLLTLSPDSQEALNTVRRVLVSSVDGVAVKETNLGDETANIAMAKILSSVDVLSSVHSLAEALFREYTLEIYPNFQRFIFHEWACKEANDAKDHSKTDNGYLVSSKYNGLSKGWLNRFFRQMELPDGISLHRRSGPGKLSQKEDYITYSTPANAPNRRHCGDVALVFGSEIFDEAAIRRFSCVSLQGDPHPKNVLLPEDIPPIFESYVEVPSFQERPFQGTLKDRISIDGWEVSLTNFVIPSQASRVSSDDKWIFCVSLVLRRIIKARPQISQRDINEECVRELQHDNSSSEASSDFQSPLCFIDSDDGRRRTMKVTQVLDEFNKKLQEQKWSQQVGEGAIIGLALMSSSNVMTGMRETLSLLYDDFCSMKSCTNGNQDERRYPQYLCQPLVDILGVHTHSKRIEATALNCLLQPYCTYITSRWVHRPLSNQSDSFLKSSGMLLLQALPPVPLALAFITILLEQKVVFSSSRRGVLTAASFGMMQLMKPLKWAHLQVPLVPVSMMNELIHYPAPFVLGCPTDDKESVSILNALPSDVTLIDLDVGRVILASDFANDASKSADEGSGEVIGGALRSQILFLAESLGGAFGVAIYRNSWCADSPFQAMPKNIDSHPMEGADIFSEVLKISSSFVSELLSGIHSCCIWIEEEHDRNEALARNESAIVFDEDQFFHLKNLRAEGRYSPLIKESDRTGANFSLSLDNFDLVFETFLRTQCLSSYISDANKESMLFW